MYFGNIVILYNLLLTAVCPIFSFVDWVSLQNHSLITLPHIEIETYHNNYMYIENHNIKNNTWSLELNKFAGFNKSYFDKNYKGYKPQYKHNHTKYQRNKDWLGPLPSELDWRNSSVVNPIKDQAQCGSCWAFSAVGALESQVMMATGENISLSEQDMVDCVKNVMSPDGTLDCCDGCEGGEMYSVYQYLEKNQNGQDNTEKQYPYTAMDGNCQALHEPSKGKYRVTGYRALESGDEKQMEEALYEVGPLSVGVNANEDWQLYKGGVYNPTEEQCSSDPDAQDHGVIVVGYGFDGVDYWIIRNSWGEDWGEKGYMRLARGNNACGVANTPIYPVLDKPVKQNQCLNSHPECPSEVCYTDCPCSCFVASSSSPCLCSAATCNCDKTFSQSHLYDF
jgi:hypothetical protein